MITHYNLQAKDHNFVMREQELKASEIELIQNSLKCYFISLEKSMEQLVDAGDDELAKMVKIKLEEVRQLRRNIDGK